MYALMYALWHLLRLGLADFFNYIRVKKDLQNLSNQHKIIHPYIYIPKDTPD
jgi:hypothetical protein